MFSPKHILVPSDFSAHSDQALSLARDIALQFHSKIHLLHVIDEKIQQCAVDYCLDIGTVERFRSEARDVSGKKLREALDRIGDGIEVAIEVREGSPHEEIAKVQHEKGIDLVVIGSRGKSGIRGHVGSVTEKVMRLAGCPVLLVGARST
ncbi:MAG TPA: universal stress protein [Syntrophales bacterium]|nr:universal stress protein [Syntrophales bacterium]